MSFIPLIREFIHRKHLIGRLPVGLLILLGMIPLPLASAGETDVFDVTRFGANGTDQLEDTKAIEAALEAARKNRGGVVYFPEGTYVVSPPGTAVVNLSRRENGKWDLKKKRIDGRRRSGNWRFGTAEPEAGMGSVGEAYLDVRAGKVYMKLDSGWILDSFLADGAGTGWRSGPGGPPKNLGNEGDVYLRYHVRFDHQNGAVFELNPRYNNITFRGDGPDKSVISFRTWSGQDPMDYEVDKEAKKVLRSSIPPNPKGRYSRGSLFVMKQDNFPENFRNIHWEGLEMRGNTIANGKHGWYNAYQDLEEWDISNKCIVFTFGGKPMHDLSVRNCSVNGWRGEILYKGGSNPAEILIENCDIFETNSSAVSISGNMIMRNSRIWNAYNGVENYCDTGQFSEIRNSSINLAGERFSGTNGIVYLGTEKAHLTVEGCEINGAQNAGIFLSDFASNVEVINNHFTDVQWGLYLYYMNLYKLPMRYDNILVQNNIFEARTRDMGFVFLNAVSFGDQRNWQILDNEVRENGAKVKIFLRDKNPTSWDNHNVTVKGNDLPNTILFDGPGSIPFMRANRSRKFAVNTYTAKEDVFAMDASNPELEITFVRNDGLEIRISNLKKYPPGHQFSLELGLTERRENGIEIVPGRWNTLERRYVLHNGDRITFEKNKDGLFDLVEFVPSGDQSKLSFKQDDTEVIN